MAAKRHHESHKSRKHEERGEERYLRGPVRHHSSSVESHEGDHLDPMHYKQPHRGDVEHAQHRRRMLGHEYYAGQNPRRTQEMEDAGMIHEDMNAIANLPQNVMMKPYPKHGDYLPEGLDDTIGGVDRQMSYDNGKREANFYPKKV